MKFLLVATIGLMWVNGFCVGAALVADLPIIGGLAAFSSILLGINVYHYISTIVD